MPAAHSQSPKAGQKKDANKYGQKTMGKCIQQIG